jgi:hypothetical protein
VLTGDEGRHGQSGELCLIEGLLRDLYAVRGVVREAVDDEPLWEKTEWQRAQR